MDIFKTHVFLCR